MQVHIISLNTFEDIGKSLPMHESVSILSSILTNADYDIITEEAPTNQTQQGHYEKLLTMAFEDKKGAPKVDLKLLDSLPPLSEFKKLYGEEPTIIGLDTCQAYQEKIPIENRVIGPAGLFNTGTNLMAQLLQHNCMFPGVKFSNKRVGMKWQVPWGKHTPASWRLNNIAIAGGKGIVQTDVLPVVTIKDPYTWMTSMCRHSYSANWRHADEHCPNLIPNEIDYSHNWFKDLEPGSSIPVNVRYNQTHKTTHKSLAHLWNDWYSAYEQVTEFPRLIVRFEDFLIYPAEITTQICECAGGVIKTTNKFKVVAESAKGSNGPHTGAEGLISAIKRYGDLNIRKSTFTEKQDIDFIRENLLPDLMTKFHYTYLNEENNVTSS